MGKDSWAIIFSLFREYNLQRLQSKQEDSTEEEEMKQQQRMAIMKDLIRKIRSKGGMDPKNRWWVSELLAKDCEEAHRMGRYHAEMVRMAGAHEEER